MPNPTPIIRVKSRQNNTTTLLVYIFYTAPFCEHLKEKGIKYSISQFAITEPGYDKGITFHQFVWHEVIIEYTDDIGELLSGWHIPSIGH